MSNRTESVAVSPNITRANTTVEIPRSPLTPFQIGMRFGFSLAICAIGAIAAILFLSMLIRERLIKSSCLMLVAFLMLLLGLQLTLFYPWALLTIFLAVPDDGIVALSLHTEWSQS